MTVLLFLVAGAFWITLLVLTNPLIVTGLAALLAIADLLDVWRIFRDSEHDQRVAYRRLGYRWRDRRGRFVRAPRHGVES